jgi:hypothetical protein
LRASEQILCRVKVKKHIITRYKFEKRVAILTMPRRQARWKWRRNPLERLIPAMEMARSKVGGRRRRDNEDRGDVATDFGA